MSSSQVSQQLILTGGLISISIFEERLMHNFYIINSKLKKMDELCDLQTKVRGIEKQVKFLNLKVDSITQKLPKDDSLVSKADVKVLSKQQMLNLFNNPDEKFMRTKYIEQSKREVKYLTQEVTRITKKKMENLNSIKLNVNNPNHNGDLGSPEYSNLGSPALSLTARQALINEGGQKKINKQSLEEILNQSQMKLVNDILKDQNTLDQINKKFDDLYRTIEELKMGKGLNDYAVRQAERFQKYQQYQRRSQQKNRSQIKLQGIKKQNLKGEGLKNDLYSEMQKAQVVKNQLNRELQSRKTLGKGSQFSNFRQIQMRKTDNIKGVQDYEVNKFHRTKSTKKLQRIEKRLKADDIKELNPVLKEIEVRIEGKVSHQIFMGFIQDFEEKLQIIKITNNSTNDISQLRKIVNNIEHRLQSIIVYLQSVTNEDDALIVKKQWTCVSCDKNLEKYGGKVGQHLNWDTLNSKKLSPTKAGAFGQTSQLASKIRNLMDNQNGSE